jgi:hypothetical protein
MSVGTTEAAASGNLTAAAWMAEMSIPRYSAFFSPSSPCVFCTSFLSTCITSALFFGTMRSKQMSSVFFRMSRFAEASARIMSMIIS